MSRSNHHIRADVSNYEKRRRDAHIAHKRDQLIAEYHRKACEEQARATVGKGRFPGYTR